LRRGAVDQIDRVSCGISGGFDRLGKQRLAARPAPVNAGFGDAGALGDPLDAGAGDAVLDE
jgi:hypothetical protein